MYMNGKYTIFFMDPMGFGGGERRKTIKRISFSKADKLRWCLNVRSFNAAINACQEGGGPGWVAKT